MNFGLITPLFCNPPKQITHGLISKFTCFIKQPTFTFYNLSVNEIKDYFELFDAMPEKLKEVLIDKMNNGEFTIKDKDEDF